MSGLLHRLAERTLNGTAPRVRSVAPVPWLAPPEIVAAEPVTPVPGFAVSQPRPASVVAVPVPEAPRAVSDDPLGAPPPGPAVMSAATTAPPPEHQESEASASPTLAVEPRESSVPPGNTLVAQHDLPLLSAPSATYTATIASLSNPVGARRLVSPLLPPPPQTAAESALVRTGARYAGAAVDSEPATEVHVHIGRVELTAISESQAPQRKTRPASTSRSLDEYLQQRKEGRR